VRVIDFIADVAETSIKLQARGILSPGEIAELTAQTLIRPDLAAYLQQSIGPEIIDPAERLCAMLLRMGEIARVWAEVCVLHHDFGSGRMAVDQNAWREGAKRYDIAPGWAASQPYTSATLADAACGGLGRVDYVSAFSQDAETLSALACAATDSPALQGATVLLLGPWAAMRPWLEASAVAPTHAGPLLHLGESSLGFSYFVRTDRREVRA
jgi:hypothetical protein